MKLNEIKASKTSVADSLKAVGVGEKPDSTLQAFLQKLADKAEKIVLKRVLNNPDDYGYAVDYGTTDEEISDGVGVWTQFAHIGEKGIAFHLNADCDDVGGDSTNHEQVFFTLDGKNGPDGRLSIGHNDFTGDHIATFNAQLKWTREE